MPFLTFFDCSACSRISYYDCSGTNVVKKNGYIYYNVKTNPILSCCSGCSIDIIKTNIQETIQQKIQNTVRVPAGLYLDNLASLTVRGDANNKPTSLYNLVNQSQASDRAVMSEQIRKLANPRLRPGKLGPGGVGVDVKHNSFDRILARKKAQNMRTSVKVDDKPIKEIKGNKLNKYGIANQKDCTCSPNFSLAFY